MSRPAWIKKEMVNGVETYLVRDYAGDWYTAREYGNRDECMVTARTVQERFCDVYHGRREYTWDEAVGLVKPEKKQYTLDRKEKPVFASDRRNKLMLSMSRRKLA